MARHTVAETKTGHVAVYWEATLSSLLPPFLRRKCSEGFRVAAAHLSPTSLLLSAGMEVRVQLLPAWPYVTQHQELLILTEGWTDPPEFLFYLPR